MLLNTCAICGIMYTVREGNPQSQHGSGNPITAEREKDMTKVTQKFLKQLVKECVAIDLTNSHEREDAPSELYTIAYSSGIYGRTGVLLKDATGKLYATTSRSTALFILLEMKGKTVKSTKQHDVHLQRNNQGKQRDSPQGRRKYHEMQPLRMNFALVMNHDLTCYQLFVISPA